MENQRELRSISVIIPVYNEEMRLANTLSTCRNYFNKKSFDFVEVIVVNDGSTDRSADVVRGHAIRDGNVRLLEIPDNRGKGYAVRQGMRDAQGKWVLFSDADLSTPIEEFDKLFATIGREGADGAIGSRAIDRSLVGKHQSVYRESSGRVFNLFMRLLTGLQYQDTQCGFKLFHADVARLISAQQRCEGFGFDVEILYIAKKHGFKIVEVPVRWYNAEGSKVTILKGANAFADLLRVLLNDIRGLYQ